MSKLSNRVEKAKKLNFVTIGGARTTLGGTRGSTGQYYQVGLFQRKSEIVTIADQELRVDVIATNCEVINVANGKLNPMEPCKGNCWHTVCYHSFGRLIEVLDQRGKVISFHEDIFSALNGLNFGGKLTKVISKQGNGYVWAVVKARPKKVKVLDNQTNINLMRGQESDEGID